MIAHLNQEEVIALHDATIKRFGGLPDMADRDRVSALLARVANYEAYSDTDIYDLAALYLVAIARGHVFNDANKRTAFNAAMLFLRRNGHAFYDHWMWDVLAITAATGEYNPEEIAGFFRRYGNSNISQDLTD